MKKLLILLFCFIFLLSSCGSQGGDTQRINNSDNHNSSIAREKKPVKGYSIEELGFAVKADKDFIGPNLEHQLESAYLTITGNSDYIMGDLTQDDLLGSFTYLCVLTVETKLSVTEIPIRYLQGFKINDIKDENSLIKVKANNYSWEDLKDYEIYKDSSIVIFDFTDFIMTESYNEYLLQYSTDHLDYDFSWTKAVYQYFNEHIGQCIIPSSEEDAGK